MHDRGRITMETLTPLQCRDEALRILTDQACGAGVGGGFKFFCVPKAGGDLRVLQTNSSPMLSRGSLPGDCIPGFVRVYCSAPLGRREQQEVNLRVGSLHPEDRLPIPRWADMMIQYLACMIMWG